MPSMKHMPPARILILADDLIWSSRLVGHARAAGFDPVAVRSADAFGSALAAIVRPTGAIVDLTSRGYDGLVEIAAARAAGLPVLAVGQHDDHVLRRKAMAAGADRVLAYRKLFDDGPATIARWWAGGRSASGATGTPAEPAASSDLTWAESAESAESIAR